MVLVLGQGVAIRDRVQAVRLRDHIGGRGIERLRDRRADDPLRFRDVERALQPERRRRFMVVTGMRGGVYERGNEQYDCDEQIRRRASRFHRRKVM